MLGVETHTNDPDASFHRILKYPARRASWLDAYQLEEEKQARRKFTVDFFTMRTPRTIP